MQMARQANARSRRAKITSLLTFTLTPETQTTNTMETKNTTDTMIHNQDNRHGSAQGAAAGTTPAAIGTTTAAAAAATPQAQQEAFSLRPMSFARLAAYYYPELCRRSQQRQLNERIDACPMLGYHLGRIGMSTHGGRGKSAQLSLRAICVIVRWIGWPERLSWT